ncbi:MAG: hemin uptake protein HemP [Pseudomonadota bacterium]
MIGETNPTLKDTPSDREVQVPTYLAQDLLQGGRVAAIMLDDQIYTLRLTRQGKLLLTK